MKNETNLEESLTSRKKLLAATAGSGALAVMALFGVAHTLPAAAPGGITADSGAETKFPPYSSPAVSAMNMGATTTTQPSDEPTVLPISKAVPSITPAAK
jgi:hypothetical protein